MKMHGISLEVAKNLVECFGGEETDMTVEFIHDGHSGPGFYAWCTDYPEEGADFLGAASEHSAFFATGGQSNAPLELHEPTRGRRERVERHHWPALRSNRHDGRGAAFRTDRSEGDVGMSDDNVGMHLFEIRHTWAWYRGVVLKETDQTWMTSKGRKIKGKSDVLVSGVVNPKKAEEAFAAAIRRHEGAVKEAQDALASAQHEQRLAAIRALKGEQ